MHRTGSPALGLMPDMGTFVERFPRVVSERALRDGAKPELVDLHRARPTTTTATPTR